MTGPDTVVKTLQCPKCGADVRPDTQFCYNCGGSIEAEETPTNNGSGTSARQPVLENTLTKPAPGLRSAREIRRKENVSDRKPKRVVWEPVERTPDVQLLIVAAAVVAFTILVILLAFYLS
jgi:hypothetical protein